MKVIYIHARPHGHPLHNEYGKSIAADTIFRDFKLRWHDVETSAFKRYLSWFVCAFGFPKKNSYDVFYSDGLVYFLVIMRKFRLIKKSQKIVGLIDDETLYFLLTGRYSKLASFLIRYSLKNYDGFICVGNFETQLIRKIIGNDKPVKTIFNGVEDNRAAKLSLLEPNQLSKKILFIGNIDSENRAYYKGLQFLLQSFELMYRQDHELELVIIGSVSEHLKQKYVSYIDAQTQKRVVFKGRVTNIEEHLKDSLFYMHCSNGESWGISVQEAMFAGVVPFVSDLTGVHQVVKLVSEDLVFEAGNSDDALAKVKKYLSLSAVEKAELSDKCRQIVKEYTWSNAVANFKTSFNALVS